MNTTMNTQSDTQSVEQFLYREAALLDRPDLDQWIELYTTDGTYWMPSIEDQVDPLNHISVENQLPEPETDGKIRVFQGGYRVGLGKEGATDPLGAFSCTPIRLNYL